MYYSCLIGINEAEKEAWKLYNNEDNDPTFNNWHKIAALRVLIDVNKSKFNMFQSGPAFMELNRLESELEAIKKEHYGDKDNRFEPFIKPASYEETRKLRELQNLDLSKLDEKQINREELERLGIPYKVIDPESKTESDPNPTDDNDNDQQL